MSGRDSFLREIEELAAVAAPHVVESDAAGRLHPAVVERLRRTPLALATAHPDRGGLGVRRVGIWADGLRLLARTDPSLAFALNMHLEAVWGASLPRWEGSAPSTFDERILDAAAAGCLLAIAGTEAGVSMLHRQSTATPTRDGWMIDARKSFVSLADAADLFLVPVALPRGRLGVALVPRGPGVEVLRRWDGLGLRATESHEVRFDGCSVDADAVIDSGEWGTWSPRRLRGAVFGNVGLLAVFVGIAESAEGEVRRALDGRSSVVSAREVRTFAGVQSLAASVFVHVEVCRAMLDRVCSLADANLKVGADDLDDLHALNAHHQAAKSEISVRAAAAVTDAMAAIGGQSYVATSTLARLQRDVRAAPFIQPYSPIEASQYLGRQRLGLDPVTDV